MELTHIHSGNIKKLTRENGREKKKLKLTTSKTCLIK